MTEEEVVKLIADKLSIYDNSFNLRFEFINSIYKKNLPNERFRCKSCCKRAANKFYLSIETNENPSFVLCKKYKIDCFCSLCTQVPLRAIEISKENCDYLFYLYQKRWLKDVTYNFFRETDLKEDDVIDIVKQAYAEFSIKEII